MTEIYYRYESYVTITEKGFLSQEQEVHITYVCTEYKVVERTPVGVYVQEYGPPKYICHNWLKKFAYPTKEEAWKAYKIRKHSHRAIIEKQMAQSNALFSDPRFNEDTPPEPKTITTEESF